MVNQRKKRIFDIIQIGYVGDWQSRLFDIVMTIAILTNLFIAIFETFDESQPFIPVLRMVELITVIGFTIEYILRVWTAEYLYPNANSGKAVLMYVFSFAGIIDLLSFFPYYLPVVFPAGAVAFRMFRIVRILRLFRVNAYSDALNVISEVINRKKNQILSSVFIVFVLMVASSLCMYSLEHDAQPDVFKNAFSGFWWAVSTLLTVGYGDIYPITFAGRIFGIAITFLGVGMVAIPTGILSAGFVEQYSSIKESVGTAIDEELKFIRLEISGNHPWVEKMVSELPIPPGMIIALIQRRGDIIIPKGDTILLEYDKVVIAAEGGKGGIGLTIKELKIKDIHPWVGCAIKDLDISRQTLIIMIRRNEEAIVPNGNTVLQADDVLYIYSKKNLMDAVKIEV